VAAAPGAVIAPAVRALPADLTPLRALAAVECAPYTVFFESGGPSAGERRWTFLAFDPLWRVEGASLDALERAWPGPVALEGAAPAPWAGGFAGFLSYDFKDALHPYPQRARRESGIPDLCLAWYDVVWAWERGSGEGRVIATGQPGLDAARRAEDARARLEEQWGRVMGAAGAAAAAPARPAPVCAAPPPASAPSPPRLQADFTRAEYRAAVRRALEHIAAGDIYQVNLAQRFRVVPAPHPAALFRALRERAPAPFSAYVALPGGDGIVSSSPERFFRIEGDRIETRPIKGTRPRGRTPAEDAALAGELRTSGKDRAENVMIVDLERNDLGRICAIGSVRVPALWEVESYSNVHHLVSRVEGTLRPGVTPGEILRAMFPGGSITGAPKIRAIQIIDELEPVRRGIFTGAIGYWDLRGGCDFNIAIRTIAVERGIASFHAGGGIVADSDPDAEYEETLDKASGMMEALGVSRGE
jgi:para-aminobenzoate synthetase component 1